MRRYTTADEERIRTSALVRDWHGSGLLDDSQSAALVAELRTDLRRTNHSLRAVLFVFGSIGVLAAFGFFLLAFRVDDEPAVAAAAMVAGVVWFLLAEYLVFQFRLYRFGVEEAFAAWSVAFVAGGLGVFVSVPGSSDDWPILVGLVTAAMVSLVVYLRFGYLYAAVGAVACAALAPMFFPEQSEAMARLQSAAILFAVFLAAHVLRRPYEDDFPGDDYGVIESAAWLGMYAVLNLRLSFETGSSGFIDAYYWGTYAVTWLLPAVGLYLGVRWKHRGMIRVNLVMALATLATNKLYLGLERRTWDPILLGVLLIGIASVVRYWLSLGSDGQRHGFTPKRILVSDRESLVALSTAAGAVQPLEVDRSEGIEKPTPYEPGGGESGGGGASGRF